MQFPPLPPARPKTSPERRRTKGTFNTVPGLHRNHGRLSHHPWRRPHQRRHAIASPALQPVFYCPAVPGIIHRPVHGDLHRLVLQSLPNVPEVTVKKDHTNVSHGRGLLGLPSDLSQPIQSTNDRGTRTKTTPDSRILTRLG